jgi:hypothetical protein
MKKTTLKDQIAELTWELANANRIIASYMKTDGERIKEIKRLGEYSTHLSITLSAVHAALNAPMPVQATPRSSGSPANIPGYSIKREGA